MASVKKPQVTRCPKCEAPKAPHRVCLECGWYGETQVTEGRATSEGEAE
jgi:large subunit ribosomal protein L32